MAFPNPSHPPGPEAGSPAAQAAVALIRTAGSDPEYLLLRRAVNPVDPWSGHFALPGGRREKADRDILDTCIRETFEETGIRLEPGHLVKPLPLAVAGGHMGRPMGVAPFLFEVPQKPELALAAREIAEFHWLAQSYLRDPANRHRAAMSLAHPDRTFPCIRVGTGGGAIWGFTYGVLERFWESALP
ncbi:MAG TPA: CoA pyrophosphatase [Fibrobacteria bacterium]|nr:CoA pyrophosphatase [Fibrobacteria bacterium]